MEEEFDYESLPSGSAATHMTAGALAGVMEHCVMYPIDSVKTRLQSLTSESMGKRGIGSVLVSMVREEGLLRPLRGMGAMVAGAGPAHALYFASYEKLKVLFSASGTANQNYWAQGAAGVVATLLHDGVMTPAEVVKQRLQMYNSPFRSMMDCVISVYRAEGIRAFYRSYGTQVVMNVPFQSTHFIVYEAMQNAVNPDRRYNPVGHMISGGVAGAVASAFTTPLDVCKTLLNTQEAGALERLHRTQIVGLMSAARTVYQLGGIRGYFQGMQARILYQVPSTAICWSVYEFFKFLLGQQSRIISSDDGYDKASDVSSFSAAVTLGGHALLSEDMTPGASARALGTI